MLVENGRVVIVSPHLDDAVLSLGGWIATASKQGAAVKVVTVMAGDPKKDLPASKWDLRCGFEGQIQATEARRKEDAAACGVVGAAHEWLPFMNGVYQLPETDDVWAALEPHLAWADFALLPGCPLRHPDHHMVTRQGLSWPICASNPTRWSRPMNRRWRTALSSYATVWRHIGKVRCRPRLIWPCRPILMGLSWWKRASIPSTGVSV